MFNQFNCPVRFSPRETGTSFRIGLLAVMITWASASVGAENPARFLSVSSWRATLDRGATNNGHRDYSIGVCRCSQDWTVNDYSLVTVMLSGSAGQIGPYRLWFSSIFDPTLSSSIQDSFHEVCITPGQPPKVRDYTAQTSTRFPYPGHVGLVIDTERGTYNLSLPLLIGYHVDDAYLAVFWLPHDGMNPGAAEVTRPLPDSGMTLAGTLSIPLSTAGQWGGLTIAADAFPYMTGNLVLTWDLTPVTNIAELEVEIKDAATGTAYENWLPMGNVNDPDQPSPNSLRIISRLVNADGTPSTTVLAESMKYELISVSHQPGLCLNAPAREIANASQDLRFLQFSNFPPRTPTSWLVESESSMQTGSLPMASAEGILSCYDSGAYATIRVTAIVNGQEIVGYRKGDVTREKAPIFLPKRAASSLIADKWKQDNSVMDKSDDDDSENDPVGDKHLGDGLSLYEEYRGFLENGKHVRTNPSKKDLFVCNLIGDADSINGLISFKALTGLAVHRNVQLEELDDQNDTQINFNWAGPAPHVVNQHGLILKTGRLKTDDEESLGASYTEHIGPPGASQRVYISPLAHVWVTVDGFADQSKTITREGIATVAHELGHACTIYHHGYADRKAANWMRVFNSDGTYKEFEDGSEIHILGEDATPFIAVSAFFWGFYPGNSARVYVGMHQGQHSGVEDCIMRYDCAQAYISPPNSSDRYLLHNPELPGIFLCDDTQGTGVNAPRAGTPWPRYGNALEGRGKCKSQLCVNDLYIGDARHDRGPN